MVEYLASHRTPPSVVDLMRDELKTMRHVPDEALSNQRRRLQTAIKRLGDRYQWQEIEEDEYRAERQKLEASLAELPLAVDANVIAFDRAAATLLPFADIISDTTPEHQKAIVGHIVERVTITDREVTDITVRLEAKPFFSDFHKGEEAVWRWRPRTDSSPQQPRRLGLLPRGRVAA